MINSPEPISEFVEMGPLRPPLEEAPAEAESSGEAPDGLVGWSSGFFPPMKLWNMGLLIWWCESGMETVAGELALSAVLTSVCWAIVFISCTSMSISSTPCPVQEWERRHIIFSNFKYLQEDTDRTPKTRHETGQREREQCIFMKRGKEKRIKQKTKPALLFLEGE